jgi:peptide/nickel transport system permease protein
MTVWPAVARRDVGIGLGLIVLLCVTAALAPFLTAHDPSTQIDLVAQQYAAPSLAHPFGTDFYSRDVLSRVLYGARISISIAALAVFVSVTLGTAVGIAAGWAGGWLDTVLMRLVDAGLAIPRIFLVLVIVALWPELGTIGLVLVLGFTSWFDTSRIVRAEVLSLRTRTFVEAARALGLSRRRTIVRHILPHLAAPVSVAVTLGIGQMILLEAGLSYLGLGIRPPTPSWGQMIADGQTALRIAPWVTLFPGIAVVITVLSFSLLGDGLRRHFNPRGS